MTEALNQIEDDQMPDPVSVYESSSSDDDTSDEEDDTSDEEESSE